VERERLKPKDRKIKAVGRFNKQVAYDDAVEQVLLLLRVGNDHQKEIIELNYNIKNIQSFHLFTL
jgi:hypothetical protein